MQNSLLLLPFAWRCMRIKKKDPKDFKDLKDLKVLTKKRGHFVF